MKKNKHVGKIVTEVLSGRKGIITERKKRNQYVLRVWVQEAMNWMTMDVPRQQFIIGVPDEAKKIGF